ncbi:hypothetical protein B0H67DRAFT_28463 [Lasiosphaeris hirsuta]|uniref:Cellobiose dehydrogenase-like cytochrome domain-containing protein n=1 Tax=Lasiosphaeris hirsuta TaxID=260670 RepID=A0AA40BAB1_9PEZI|nr:hypothetical protein B0H67DRAFT_28463 [Lasiosphaeris hirsuta]
MSSRHTRGRSVTKRRGLLAAFGFGLFSSQAAAQTKVTTPFVDQGTGIQFQRFFGAKTNFGFGIALPTNPSNSFIGQLSFPLANGAGWASFREAFNEDDNPPEITGAFSVKPIADGTSVNNTFLTFTFLCEGCLDDSFGLGAAQTAGTAEMGWALASRAVRNPASSAGVLAFHNSGFGDFKANLGSARNAEFDTWAALAGTALPPAANARAFSGNGGDGDDDDDDDDSGDEGDSGAGAGGGTTTGGSTGGITTGGGGKAGGGAAGGVTTGGGGGGQTGGGLDDGDDSDDDSDDD